MNRVTTTWAKLSCEFVTDYELFVFALGVAAGAAGGGNGGGFYVIGGFLTFFTNVDEA